MNFLNTHQIILSLNKVITFLKLEKNTEYLLQSCTAKLDFKDSSESCVESPDKFYLSPDSCNKLRSTRKNSKSLDKAIPNITNNTNITNSLNFIKFENNPQNSTNLINYSANQKNDVSIDLKNRSSLITKKMHNLTIHNSDKTSQTRSYNLTTTFTATNHSNVLNSLTPNANECNKTYAIKVDNSLPVKLSNATTVDSLHKNSTRTSTFSFDGYDMDNAEPSKSSKLLQCVKPLQEIPNEEIINKSSLILEDFVDEPEKEGYNIINTKQGCLHYISIDLYLKHLATIKETPKDFSTIDAFLLQYTCFMTPTVLINKLINLHNFLKGSAKGIVTLVNKWVLLKFQEEIVLNPELKDSIKSYYELLLVKDGSGQESDSSILSQKDIDEIVSYYSLFTQDSKYDQEYNLKHLKGRKKSSGVISFKCEALIPKLKSNVFNILEWDEHEIARQMTLISHKLFAKLEYKEMLSTCWTKRDKYTSAPNVMKIIDRSNTVSLWLIEEILSYDKKKQRAEAILKFLKVAQECKNLNNFNDCMTILGGVNNFIIKNMKKTWSVMEEDAQLLLQELSTFCSYDNNFKNMRNEMGHVVGKHCVPYLGMLLGELAFIEEGPKYIRNEFLINLDKISKVHKAINFFLQFKASAYLYKHVEELSILADMHPKCEEELEAMAGQIEPVFQKIKTSTKRITNTDSKTYKLKPNYGDYLLNAKNSGTSVIKIDDHF